MTRTFIIVAVNGMCNRLRAIASGWILSQHLNREFKAIWNPTKDIGYSQFEDLFESEDWIIDSYISDDAKVYTAGIKTEMGLLEELCSDKSECIVLEQSGGNYIPPGMSIEQFNTLKNEFYNKLTPVSQVSKKVNKFIETNDLSVYLGVHIRRTDRKSLTPNTEMFGRAIERFNSKICPFYALTMKTK